MAVAKKKKVSTKKKSERSERLDLRLTKAEKAKVQAKATATRRTLASIVQELIENM